MKKRVQNKNKYIKKPDPLFATATVETAVLVFRTTNVSFCVYIKPAKMVAKRINPKANFLKLIFILPLTFILEPYALDFGLVLNAFAFGFPSNAASRSARIFFHATSNSAKSASHMAPAVVASSAAKAA